MRVSTLPASKVQNTIFLLLNHKNVCNSPPFHGYAETGTRLYCSYMIQHVTWSNHLFYVLFMFLCFSISLSSWCCVFFGASLSLALLIVCVLLFWFVLHCSISNLQIKSALAITNPRLLYNTNEKGDRKYIRIYYQIFIQLKGTRCIINGNIYNRVQLL